MRPIKLTDKPYKGGTFFISEDIASKMESKGLLIDEEAQYWSDAFYRRLRKAHQEILTYVSLYERLTGLKNTAILNAHGQFDGRNWIYFDGEEQIPIQEWIDCIDGKYSNLAILACCQHERFKLKSKKSLLIVPDREVDTLSVEEGRSLLDVLFRLFVPGKGMINPYAYEKETEELNAKLEAKLKRRKK